jgi:hypothetical protein
MHERAASIHRTHSNANTYLEVFDVQGQPGYGKCLYIWVATRQLEGGSCVAPSDHGRRAPSGVTRARPEWRT